MKHHPKDKLRR